MRAVLLFIIIAVLIIIAAVATGFVSISKLRGGEAPQVSASGSGVSAKGGEAPAFDVETGSVKVGTKQTSMNMPTLEIQKAGQKQSAEKTSNSM